MNTSYVGWRTEIVSAAMLTTLDCLLHHMIEVDIVQSHPCRLAKA